MNGGMSRNSFQKAFFLILLFFAVAPHIAFPIMSYHYQQLSNLPGVREGALDLAGFDLYDEAILPLDGDWEFFSGRWIVSEPARQEGPDGMAAVPAPRTWRDAGLSALPPDGKCSYRILLKHCPADVELVSYIPDVNSDYRIYLNGQLVSSRGGQDQGPHGEAADDKLTLYGVSIPAEGGDAELVIEWENPHIKGLYLTPVLAELSASHAHRDLRNLIAASCIGVMAVSIGCIICFMFLQDQLLNSMALATMDIIVFLRLLTQNEFFDVIRQIVPSVNYYYINIGLRIVSFYLPLIFLICIKQLIRLRIKKRNILLIGFYMILLSLLLFWCAANGRPRIQYFICLAAYLPFLYVIARLYGEDRKPYCMLASASLVFIMNSAMTASLNDSGLLKFSISLFSPICFVIALIFQLMLYIRRSYELKMRATEAENLRLRLKDSETSLMLSQIKPHFLYNTLIAIHMMCLEEPKAAADTILKFAAFLQTNMRFINSREPIPFLRELEHIRNYAEIEELRFQSRLRMKYEIGPTDFYIPALTIQPLVENAIRHGACKNIEGGSVILRTCETESDFCIEVIDDGPGFDTNIIGHDAQNSFGIQNITFRLKEQVGADVAFYSAEDKGTTVRVSVPKEGIKDAGDYYR